MIQFPAILKLSGQDELFYVSDKASFTQHYQLQQPYLLPDDLLIDNTGQAYSLQPFFLDACINKAIREFSLPELTTLVQAHFFASAQTCVTKIQAADINSLFLLLPQSD